MEGKGWTPRPRLTNKKCATCGPRKNEARVCTKQCNIREMEGARDLVREKERHADKTMLRCALNAPRKSIRSAYSAVRSPFSIYDRDRNLSALHIQHDPIKITYFGFISQQYMVFMHRCSLSLSYLSLHSATRDLASWLESFRIFTKHFCSTRILFICADVTLIESDFRHYDVENEHLLATEHDGRRIERGSAWDRALPAGRIGRPHHMQDHPGTWH